MSRKCQCKVVVIQTWRRSNAEIFHCAFPSLIGCGFIATWSWLTSLWFSFIIIILLLQFSLTQRILCKSAQWRFAIAVHMSIQILSVEGQNVSINSTEKIEGSYKILFLFIPVVRAQTDSRSSLCSKSLNHKEPAAADQTLLSIDVFLGCGCHWEYWTELFFRNWGISLCFYPKTAIVLQCCASHIPSGPQSIPQTAVGKVVRPLWVWRPPRNHGDKN